MYTCTTNKLRKNLVGLTKLCSKANKIVQFSRVFLTTKGRILVNKQVKVDYQQVV